MHIKYECWIPLCDWKCVWWNLHVCKCLWDYYNELISNSIDMFTTFIEGFAIRHENSMQCVKLHVCLLITHRCTYSNLCLYVSGEKNWWWWVWWNIWRNWSCFAGSCSIKVRINMPAKASPENGSCCSQKTSGFVCVCWQIQSFELCIWEDTVPTAIK